MIALIAAAALATQTAPARTPTATIGINPPRLVVVVSVDQFRGDFIRRFHPYFLPAKSGSKLGGFRFLMETGADFLTAMHNHVPTVTGVGHATLLTGSEPAYNGIIANDWYDRATGKDVYCTDDPEVETVGGESKPMSPKNLQVTTVGDELKMTTNGKSKVVGVALKDRASILMAGHAADTVIWFDNKTGNFVTSTWYAPNKKLPAWVQAFNAERRLDKLAGKAWEPLLANEAYSIARNSPGTKPAENGKPFSHAMPATVDEKLYSATWSSPWGNENTLAAAARAVEAEQLGQDEFPDVLVINLSSNDYIGHAYGPNSPEVMDITIQTDRMISDFLNLLQAKVPGGIDNVAFVVSGDHGVVPIAREAREVYKVPVLSGVGRAMMDAMNAALVAKYGPGKWILGDGGPNIYLDHELAAQKGIDVKDLISTAVVAARGVPGVFNAFTREQLLNNGVPDYPFKERITNGYHAKMGGDLFVLEAPGNYLGGPNGTGHNAIWDYDAHVPILFRARGIKPGRYLNRVYTNAIAPTISCLLGIEVPSGNVGVPLVDRLEK
ncbi:MAG: Alkaline phosphatase PafA [Fimbriimonadaceae bacterium]|nr:Alkaline phosphatase PafA [Fimbriimonadaceae bacterium]